jgi:hypothetical protein
MDPSLREDPQFAITSSREKNELARFLFARTVEGLKLFEMKLN